MFEAFDGFVANLTDKKVLTNTGMAMLGGAGAGIAVNVAKAKIPFLRPSTNSVAAFTTMDLVKEGVLAAAISLLAGAATADDDTLSMIGAGAQGAMGSRLGMLLVSKYAPTLIACPTCVQFGRRLPMAGHYPALQGARVHDEDVLGLRVGTEDPDEALAGIFGAGAY